MSRLRWRISDEGFTLVEVLIAILVFSMAIGLFLSLSTRAAETYKLITGYFSPETPTDSYAYANQLLAILSDYMLKKKGAKISQDLNETLKRNLGYRDIGVRILGYEEIGGLEIITLEATYVKPGSTPGDIKVGSIIRKIVRRK